MPATDTKSATWDYIISEYQAIVYQYHWPFKPMLKLAQELAISAPAALYPGMSHEHLGFSLVPDYPQCVQVPQVWISYQAQSDTFEVMFREALRGPQSKVICQTHEVKSVAEKALAILLERKPEPD